MRGLRPDLTEYEGAAEHLQEVWIAVRSALRSVLEFTTIEQVAEGTLPEAVTRYTQDPDAWVPHIRLA